MTFSKITIFLIFLSFCALFFSNYPDEIQQPDKLKSIQKITSTTSIVVLVSSDLKHQLLLPQKILSQVNNFLVNLCSTSLKLQILNEFITKNETKFRET